MSSTVCPTDPPTVAGTIIHGVMFRHVDRDVFCRPIDLVTAYGARFQAKIDAGGAYIAVSRIVEAELVGLSSPASRKPPAAYRTRLLAELEYLRQRQAIVARQIEELDAPALDQRPGQISDADATMMEERNIFDTNGKA